jgi:hypothetical protein
LNKVLRELILRGVKTIEYRSRPTKIIGERFYIYASRKWAGVNGHDVSVMPAQAGIQKDARPPLDSRLRGNDSSRPLPTGVIVGTAMISECRRENGHYCWHLSDVQRLDRPRKPKRQPQPVWFRPF